MNVNNRCPIFPRASSRAPCEGFGLRHPDCGIFSLYRALRVTVTILLAIDRARPGHDAGSSAKRERQKPSNPSNSALHNRACRADAGGRHLCNLPAVSFRRVLVSPWLFFCSRASLRNVQAESSHESHPSIFLRAASLFEIRRSSSWAVSYRMTPRTHRSGVSQRPVADRAGFSVHAASLRPPKSSDSIQYQPTPSPRGSLAACATPLRELEYGLHVAPWRDWPAVSGVLRGTRSTPSLREAFSSSDLVGHTGDGTRMLRGPEVEFGTQCTANASTPALDAAPPGAP